MAVGIEKSEVFFNSLIFVVAASDKQIYDFGCPNVGCALLSLKKTEQFKGSF